MYFIKLAILVFGCPRDRYITNFTRKPLLQKPVGELLLTRLQGNDALLLLWVGVAYLRPALRAPTEEEQKKVSHNLSS